MPPNATPSDGIRSAIVASRQIPDAADPDAWNVKKRDRTKLIESTLRVLFENGRDGAFVTFENADSPDEYVHLSLDENGTAIMEVGSREWVAPFRPLPEDAAIGTAYVSVAYTTPFTSPSQTIRIDRQTVHVSPVGAERPTPLAAGSYYWIASYAGRFPPVHQVRWLPLLEHVEVVGGSKDGGGVDVVAEEDGDEVHHHHRACARLLPRPQRRLGRSCPCSRQPS